MLELNKCTNQIKISYFFNLFISIITVLLNIFYEENISIIIDLASQIIFYLFVIITSFIAISQIIFLALTSGRLTHKLFSILLRILLVYLIASLIISIPLSVFYYITNNKYPNFYMDCPFNYGLSYIKSLLNSTSIYNNNIKRKCNNKICLEMKIIDNNIFEYSYICNFDSSYKNVMYCNNYIYFNKILIKSDVINNYINLCLSETDFYICHTNKRPDKYYINYNYICPTKKSKSFILGIILSIFNIIDPILIFVVKFILYKKILNLIYLRDINVLTSMEDKKTNNSSRIKENDNLSFQQLPCELIIVEGKEHKNEVKKNNMKNNNNNLKFNLSTGIETTKNEEIINNINYSSIKDNNKNKINAHRKNNSFSNLEINHLKIDDINLLNSFKTATETKFHKDRFNKKNYEKSMNENSEIRYIKINK